MVVKVFTSRLSGNNKIRNQQQKILDVLASKKIEFVEIDISDTKNDEAKLAMRAGMPASEDNKMALPPQIFTDDEYVGDYDAFCEAIEDETLWTFLKIPIPESEDLSKMKRQKEASPAAEAGDAGDAEAPNE